jgi:hypothetical protein
LTRGSKASTTVEDRRLQRRVNWVRSTSIGCATRVIEFSEFVGTPEAMP